MGRTLGHYLTVSFLPKMPLDNHLTYPRSTILSCSRSKNDWTAQKPCLAVHLKSRVKNTMQLRSQGNHSECLEHFHRWIRESWLTSVSPSLLKTPCNFNWPFTVLRLAPLHGIRASTWGGERSVGSWRTSERSPRVVKTLVSFHSVVRSLEMSVCPAPLKGDLISGMGKCFVLSSKLF